MELPVLKPGQPTAMLAKRFRDPKTTILYALDRSYCQLRRTTSSHHKSPAVRENHHGRKRLAKKRVNPDGFKCQAGSCLRLGELMFHRDPDTADRISLRAGRKGGQRTNDQNRGQYSSSMAGPAAEWQVKCLGHRVLPETDLPVGHLEAPKKPSPL